MPAILLDLDGTIIDSQPGILSSARAALHALGHVPDPALDVSAIIGPPIQDVMEFLLAPYGDVRVDEAVNAYRADYARNGLLQSRAYPGIAEALAEMRQSGARLFVAASKDRSSARRILEHLGFAALFEGIHGAEPGGASDHKPELIAHIVERHTLAPASCVMVGDRRYDVAGAHANEMRALGVLWGYGTRAELEAAGADDLVAGPDALPKTALAMAMVQDNRVNAAPSKAPAV